MTITGRRNKTMSHLHRFTQSDLSETENDAMQVNESCTVNVRRVNRDKRGNLAYDKLTAIWRKASSLLASFDDELA